MPTSKERLVRGLMQWCGRSEAETRETVLTGGVAQMQDTLGKMREAGVQQVYILTFLPAWNREQLEQCITEVAPALR